LTPWFTFTIAVNGNPLGKTFLAARLSYVLTVSVAKPSGIIISGIIFSAMTITS